jgi:hypothetical protein
MGESEMQISLKQVNFCYKALTALCEQTPPEGQEKVAWKLAVIKDKADDLVARIQRQYRAMSLPRGFVVVGDGMIQSLDSTIELSRASIEKFTDDCDKFLTDTIEQIAPDHYTPIAYEDIVKWKTTPEMLAKLSWLIKPPVDEGEQLQAIKAGA